MLPYIYLLSRALVQLPYTDLSHLSLLCGGVLLCRGKLPKAEWKGPFIRKWHEASSLLLAVRNMDLFKALVNFFHQLIHEKKVPCVCFPCRDVPEPWMTNLAAGHLKLSISQSHQCAVLKTGPAEVCGGFKYYLSTSSFRLWCCLCGKITYINS